MSQTPELTATLDQSFVIQVRRAIGHILCRDQRLDAIQLHDENLIMAAASGMADAVISVRSHALDPNILADHLVKAIRQDPRQKQCALAIGGIDIKRVDPGAARGPWEATITGWWIPMAMVAHRNGVGI